MPRSEWRPRLRWATALPGLLPAGVTRRSGQQPFSLVAPFLRLALLLSLGAGFGLGAALATGEALSWPRGVWWPALVRTSRAPNLHIRSAYGWLALGGLVLVVDGVARLVGDPFVLPEDGWRHILTAGYLTMLIMGVGARLLPGFARVPPRPSRRLLVVVVFANLAAFLRAMPPLADAFGGNGAVLNVAFGVSGPCALIAVGLFTWYVWPMLHG